MIRRLRRDRRGNVLIVTAMGAVALFGAAGFTIDLTRSWMMRSRLATSLDAAAITAARGYTPGVATDPNSALGRAACAVFWANFGVGSSSNPCATPGGGARGFMGTYSENPVITVGANNTLTVTANARLDTTLSRVLSGAPAELRSQTAAAAIRTVSSLEIAMALDVTASMYPDGKFSALRTAAQNFITSIFGSQETRENTWVSITPYTTHVNIGTAAYATAMVNAASRAQFDGLYDSRNQAVPWQGCIEARYRRIGGNSNSPFGDVIDEPPTASDPNTQFRAWFYSSTLNSASPPQSRYSMVINGTTTYLPGDNDWRSYIPNDSAVNGRAINEWALNQNTTRPGAPQGGTYQNPRDVTGPHMGCLFESRYVVLPLTAERSTLLSRITNLEAEPWQWHRYITRTASFTHGGTVIHQGLHMAWLTISPRWTDLWGLPRTPNNRTLPLLTENAGQKVIVLMTDGNNEFYPYARIWRPSGSSGEIRQGRGAPGSCEDQDSELPRLPRHPLPACPRDSNNNPRYRGTDTGYGPYGRLSGGGLVNSQTGTAISVATVGSDGSTLQDAAVEELNRRLATLCTNIKNGGVHIYTVGFAISSGSTANTLLRNCATTTQDYFLASNAAALNAAFVEIANRVGRVRLVR